MFDPRNGKKKIFGDSTTGVFVSLYLIVLAFFIVMNVISNQVKSKVSASVSSVNDTFKAEYIREADQLDPPTDGRASTPNKDFQRSIEDALQFSELEIDNRHITRGGSQLRVDIKVDDLFFPNSAIFNPRTSQALTDLVELMNASKNGEVREFAFFFGYGSSGSSDVVRIKQMLAMKRAGVLARQLGVLEAKEGTFSTGYRGSDETKVTAIFRTSTTIGYPLLLEPMEETL